ncbi:MAG: alkyldihydroxyacetonephosphate synthase [Actinomycetes bacterium]|nr:MAG: alkyldihydroxyacetonephosphate synthase [Actinomycetes bacterium]
MSGGRGARRERSHWGWGWAGRQPDRGALAALAPAVRERLGFGGERVEEPVPLEAVDLAPPRARPPAALGGVVSADPPDRIRHAMGRAYRDVVRGFRGRFDRTPDLVAFPGDEEDVRRVLELCADRGFAAVPFGGGTSVVGGVEPRVGHGYRGVVSLDLGGLSGVVAVDEVSGAALIRAGTLGPDLEDGLRPHGLTLRHFPQSFELSTLGGWIATRAGGHFAMLQTHIDDLVLSARALTPTGPWESRRLPGSGAGPSPDRMLLGSEGILGVITEAWVQVRPRPAFKASRPVLFESFAAGAEAVRALSRSGLNPSNCRLLDPLEAGTTGAGAGDRAVLIIGFESAFAPVDEQLRLAVGCAADHGGEPEPDSGDDRPASAAESWRSAFLGAPYLRDSLVALGVLSETFETAITWDRFGEFHARVTEAARRAVAEACDGPAEGPGSPRVTCRFTHVYPTGPAPYYTVLAPARRGSEVEQWDEIKAAVSEAIISAGGTITHHHAVGRDHRPWYELQRPDRFAAALAGAKAAVDPAAIMNPGVLIDPAAPPV